MDLDLIRILCMCIVQWDQADVMIPDRNMLIALAAADALRVETDDSDRVGPERDQAKEPEAIGRGASDRPD